MRSSLSLSLCRSTLSDCLTMGAENRSWNNGCTSSIFHCLLRWLNYSVVLASILTIVCMLALRIAPSAWGWCFLSFSFLSVSSAVVGCITRGGSACHSLHMFLLISSACSQCSMFLLLISRPDTVLARLQSNRSESDGKVVLKVDASLLLWIFCAQIIVLAMSCILHYCEPVDYYEDLEGNLRKTRRRLSRVQEESIADAQAEAAKPTVSLVQKEMREKYRPQS